MADRLQQRRARQNSQTSTQKMRSSVAVFLGTLKGKPEIEGKAIADQIKKTPKITVHPIGAQQSGNVVWGPWASFVFDDGPSGNYGDHGRQQRWFVAYRHACF